MRYSPDIREWAVRMVINHEREMSREEALSILQQNQDDGLVLQPSNAQQAEIICSCCGCCCGICVPTCPVDAIHLVSTEQETVPPLNEEELNDIIISNKKGAMSRFLMFLKIMFRMRK